jgi:hypothetical protein
MPSNLEDADVDGEERDTIIAYALAMPESNCP